MKMALSGKLENASKGTSTSLGTEIEPFRESSCKFLLERLPIF